MDKLQYDAIVNPDKFMAEFGFSVNSETPPFDFETPVWKFRLDQKNPVHRKQTVKSLYALLDQCRYAFTERWLSWELKYQYMSHYWGRMNAALAQINICAKKLTKPLYQYAQDRQGRYQNSNAEAYRLADNEFSLSRTFFQNHSKISDTPPVLDVAELDRCWRNLQLQIELETKGYVKKAAKKHVVVDYDTPIRVKSSEDASGIHAEAKDVKAALKAAKGCEFLNMGGSTIRTKTFVSWLNAAGIDHLIFMPTDKGFSVTGTSNKSNFRVVATFNNLPHDIVKDSPTKPFYFI